MSLIIFVTGKEKKTIYPGSTSNTRLVCNKDKNSNIDYITYISARGDFEKIKRFLN